MKIFVGPIARYFSKSKVSYDVTHLARKKVADQKLKFMLEKYRANTSFWDYFEN